MLLVIGGIKGGSGKTTLATNLCQMRSAEGYKVLLVDADEQKSSHEWSMQRDNSGLSFPTLSKSFKPFVTVCLSGKSVYSNLLKMKGDYDDIIVDTGGRDTTSQRSALCGADIFLLPFKPSAIDIWTIGSVKNIIRECVNPNLKSYAIINQADTKGRDNEESLQIIKEYEEINCLEFLIRSRKAFKTAASAGLGVNELSPRDDKACKEIQDLYNVLYK